MWRNVLLILIFTGIVNVQTDAKDDQCAWELTHHCTVTATYGPGPYETNPRIELLTCDGGVKTWRYAR